MGWINNWDCGHYAGKLFYLETKRKKNHLELCEEHGKMILMYNLKKESSK